MTDSGITAIILEFRENWALDLWTFVARVDICGVLKGRSHYGGTAESCCSARLCACQEGALLSGNRWFLLLTGERSACPPGTQQL